MSIASDLLKPVTFGKDGVLTPTLLSQLSQVGLFQTASVSLLAPSVGNLFTELTPRPPAAQYFFPTTGRFIVEDLDGTITTGPTTNCGNNAAKDNVRLSGAAALTAAELNAAAAAIAGGAADAFAPYNPSAGATGNGFVAYTGNPFAVDVTVAVVLNTATVCTGRWMLQGFWVG